MIGRSSDISRLSDRCGELSCEVDITRRSTPESRSELTGLLYGDSMGNVDAEDRVVLEATTGDRRTFKSPLLALRKNWQWSCRQNWWYTFRYIPSERPSLQKVEYTRTNCTLQLLLRLPNFCLHDQLQHFPCFSKLLQNCLDFYQNYSEISFNWLTEFTFANSILHGHICAHEHTLQLSMHSSTIC